MQDFVTFVGDLLPEVSAFLLTDPIQWFVGIFLLVAVAQLFKMICNLS